MLWAILVITLISSICNCKFVLGELTDNHESCEFWSNEGECESNPSYMLENCAKSCGDLVDRQEESESFSSSQSVYDVVGEKDSRGQIIDFNKYRGQVLYIVNVASQCGYTNENYEMFRKLKQFRSKGLEIMLAPCNQFGDQEPGSGLVIEKFAKSQEFEGILLEKADVNGAETRPLFQFLKENTSKKHINWNFDGKFLVDRNGRVHSVTQATVENKIKELLNRSEL